MKKLIKFLIVLILIIGSFLLYSRYLGTKGLNIKEYGITDKNLPSNFYGLKIVHISDIHYKTTIDKDYLKKLYKKINKLKPDIVVITGDILDSNIKYTDDDYKVLNKFLKNIDSNLGKYIISGDNDSNINKIIDNTDFIDLNNSYDLIYNNGIEPILLVGISSNYKKNHIKDDLNKIYSEIKTTYKYSILLLHEPDFISDIEYSKFNLILAGHTLNGQIVIPFVGGIINQKYTDVYNKEYYKLSNTRLYISTGLGTSKYKFRFLNKPSINFYRLTNK